MQILPTLISMIAQQGKLVIILTRFMWSSFLPSFFPLFIHLLPTYLPPSLPLMHPSFLLCSLPCLPFFSPSLLPFIFSYPTSILTFFFFSHFQCVCPCYPFLSTLFDYILPVYSCLKVFPTEPQKCTCNIVKIYYDYPWFIVALSKLALVQHH